MENMLSRNSFPQICVVSVNQFVGNQDIKQEHVRSRALSNQDVYFLGNTFETNCDTWKAEGRRSSCDRIGRKRKSS